MMKDVFLFLNIRCLCKSGFVFFPVFRCFYPKICFAYSSLVQQEKLMMFRVSIRFAPRVRSSYLPEILRFVNEEIYEISINYFDGRS